MNGDIQDVVWLSSTKGQTCSLGIMAPDGQCHITTGAVKSVRSPLIVTIYEHRWMCQRGTPSASSDL